MVSRSIGVPLLIARKVVLQMAIAAGAIRILESKQRGSTHDHWPRAEHEQLGN